MVEGVVRWEITFCLPYHASSKCFHTLSSFSICSFSLSFKITVQCFGAVKCWRCKIPVWPTLICHSHETWSHQCYQKKYKSFNLQYFENVVNIQKWKIAETDIVSMTQITFKRIDRTNNSKCRTVWPCCAFVSPQYESQCLCQNKPNVGQLSKPS